MLTTAIARGNLTTPGQMGLIGRPEAQPRSFDALQASPVRTIGAYPPYRRESIATDEATIRYFILIVADWLGCQKKQDGGRIEPDEVPHILASAK